jgi:ribosomal protein S27AE
MQQLETYYRDSRPKRKAAEPRVCPRCGGEVFWAKWDDTKTRVVVDSVPDFRPPPRGGRIVLVMRLMPKPHLLAFTYKPRLHPPTRNRYTDHWDICPP